MKKLYSEQEKKERGLVIKLSLLCLFIYISSYLGRKVFDSNIENLKELYDIHNNDTVMGLIGTFFLIAYGCGQVFHGIMCKRYNQKIMIPIALIVASIVNILMVSLPKTAFSALKYLWFISGFSHATLWSSIVLVVNKSVSKKYIAIPLFIFALPVTIGTFMNYALSSLFTFIGHFKFTFYLSAVAMTVAAIFWFLKINKLKDDCLAFKEKEVQSGKKGVLTIRKGREFVIIFVAVAILSIINNFIKDGINTWLPTMLKNTYELSNWQSILCTSIVPLFGVIGGLLAVSVVKKFGSIQLLSAVLYITTGFAVLTILFFFDNKILILTLVCFIISSIVMASSNAVLTSVFPLSCEGVNAGMISGLVDGFCYIGSALSAVGYGALNDAYGWKTVITIIVAVAFFAVIVSIISYILQNTKVQKAKKQ